MWRLLMKPGAGERLARYVGDRLCFTVSTADRRPLPEGWRVLLRTNLGRARAQRQEIVSAYPACPPLAGSAWHDIPLRRVGADWVRELTLAEPGYFRAKAYAVDPQGRQHWVEGPDLGISIHADTWRVGNTIYCAFARLFGPTKGLRDSASFVAEIASALDAKGFTVIPPSGKLRDLIRELPHILDRLGCRILHLLPVSPTPTTYARFGRFGSPYAVQDLTAIDPALVEFDKRTTGVEQFEELTLAVHERGGKVLLDIPINHTGWGSVLQERHPEWFVRKDNGEFVSPGAWGVTWEDLVELDHRHAALWRDLAEVFRTWCRRGVDGFRCDAGYKVPVEVWRYITAAVHEEFPETLFLLEGLGGSWEATERLLTEGGMQWAYSELFQNYTGSQVAGYLDYSLSFNQQFGLHVHYSETHDNPRLAQRGRAWSLLRNRLCALAGSSGAFGFTCGVEWLATEKINVHGSSALAWGGPDNLVAELAALNRLISLHPCFFDGAVIERISSPDSEVLALRRVSPDGQSVLLVLVNTNPDAEATIELPCAELPPRVLAGEGDTDLLGVGLPRWDLMEGERLRCVLPAGGVNCISIRGVSSLEFAAPGNGLPRPPYALERARAAWAIQALAATLPMERIGPVDWQWLAERVNEAPEAFLGSLYALDLDRLEHDARAALEQAAQAGRYLRVVVWTRSDATRVLPVPANHWVLLRDEVAFEARVETANSSTLHLRSIATRRGHVVALAPPGAARLVRIHLQRYGAQPARITSSVQWLVAPLPSSQASATQPNRGLPSSPAECVRLPSLPPADALVLLTNGRGGMARIRVDPGRTISKYDCVLGANLHPELPVDRHIFVKRVRAWVNADGFISPLEYTGLVAFDPDPPATWTFVANAGDGRAVGIVFRAEMIAGQNTTRLQWARAPLPPGAGRELEKGCAVSLTIRVDIEDRNFHQETHRHAGAEAHFAAHCHALHDGEGTVGFQFSPAPERTLRVTSDRGVFHAQPEWSQGIHHVVEATRGLADRGDAYSPGWFEVPLGEGEEVAVTLTAEAASMMNGSRPAGPPVQTPADAGDWETELRRATEAFLVRRGQGFTVVAGYPWFLDWGRDTLVAARGLLAAGKTYEVQELLRLFGRFEDRGSLPNAIFGENASNRETSDAPLWYGLLCHDLLTRGEREFALTSTPVDDSGRTVGDVLRSIALHYQHGTRHGIRMDPDSGLIWSPSHFTWMDTNHPAATPREGYPVEIQVLWIRLLRLLCRLGLASEGEPWESLAARAQRSFDTLFWIEKQGWLADVLLAAQGQPARAAVPQDALRPNMLLAVTLGLVKGERARDCVAAASRHLLVPGGLRSLAPLPVSPPLPVRASDGRLLNNPSEPYWGRYEGDEDTRRKPAYHNGTAWTWLLPTYCEALAMAWDWQPDAVAAARDLMGSLRDLMQQGCLGHIPEILDGDAPHTARGCDAQAWSVTEALRVWHLLIRSPTPGDPPR